MKIEGKEELSSVEEEIDWRRDRRMCRTWQVDGNVCSSLSLPVSVDDRAFSATNILVVPPPGLGVDGLA